MRGVTETAGWLQRPDHVDERLGVRKAADRFAERPCRCSGPVQSQLRRNDDFISVRKVDGEVREPLRHIEDRQGILPAIGAVAGKGQNAETSLEKRQSCLRFFSSGPDPEGHGSISKAEVDEGL